LKKNEKKGKNENNRKQKKVKSKKKQVLKNLLLKRPGQRFSSSASIL